MNAPFDAAAAGFGEGWVPWAGEGYCPLHPDTLIEIIVLSAGDDGGEPRKLFKRKAGVSVWGNPRVVAYRVVQAVEGTDSNAPQ